MKLVTHILRQTSLMTGIFLFVAMLATGGIYWSSHERQIASSLESDMVNATAAIQKSYGSGDLIALRSTLEQIATASNWQEAKFLNKSRETIWDFATPEMSNKAVVKDARDVRFANLEVAGRLEITKNIEKVQREFYRKICTLVVFTLGFWVVFLWLTRVMVKRILQPLMSLMQDVASEARCHGLDLNQNDGRDELTVIRSWFAQLVQSWKVEKDRALENERSAAIAKTTGMLAHDIRKPFSILRMGLGMLGHAKDPQSVKAILARLVPEIDKAVSSADGLIADVMEVGSTSTQILQELASPESLIEATLSEIFRIYPKSSIEISYDLQHVSMANVHVQKVSRVFSNIVANAIQAMGQRGRMWFRTSEEAGQIQFCIGNAGSLISAHSLPKLFEAFYTSGKKGGTGLGLAIAEKVVKAHGGRIWCESAQDQDHPDGYVEFKFLLPAGLGSVCNTTARLPHHSSEITNALAELDAIPAMSGSVDKSELTLEEEIAQASTQLGRALRLLVVDDEAIYQNGLVAYLSRTTELRGAVEVIKANGSKSALAVIADSSIDLIITDVDMGPHSLDGFELVAAMRTAGVNALICVHSNRIVAADHKTAMIAGADAFLPKPVARAQLLRLVLQSAQASQERRQRSPAAVAAARPEVLVVDDNVFVLEAWEDALRADAVVHTATNFEELRDRLETDPNFARRLFLAVTDLHLDGSAGDGLDVGRLLKKHKPDLRVLLSSDGMISNAELTGAIDLKIGKSPLQFSALNSLSS